MNEKKANKNIESIVTHKQPFVQSYNKVFKRIVLPPWYI